MEAGYRIAWAPVSLAPYAAFQAQSFATPNYTETSGTNVFALSYAARTGSVERAEAGSWLSNTYRLPDNAVATAFGRVAYAHDWQNAPQAAATFVALAPVTSFITNGTKPAADLAVVTAGAEIQLAAGIALMGKFDGEFGAGTRTYVGTARKVCVVTRCLLCRDSAGIYGLLYRYNTRLKSSDRAASRAVTTCGWPQIKVQINLRDGGLIMQRAIAVLAGIAALASLGYSASAADLAVQAAPAPVAAPSWTGLYIGVHGGAAMPSSSDWAFNDPSGVALPVTLKAGSAALGAVGGLQVGYNWQFAPAWVTGVEGDFSWASLADHRTVGPLTVAGAVIPGSSVSMSANTQWLSSARAKLGFTGWFNNTMLYATGGAALANIEYNAQFSPVAGVISAVSRTTTKSGWVAGGGAEWMATSQILLRAEYLYYGINAGDSEDSHPLPATFPRRLNYSWSRDNIQVFRVAGSYKF